MNPCMKTEVKCNESVNNEFKITRKRLSLHQIMRWANKDTNSPYSHLLSYFLNSLFWYNSFAEVRQDSLHFDSIMSLTHYESISVTWANKSVYLCVIFSFHFQHIFSLSLAGRLICTCCRTIFCDSKSKKCVVNCMCWVAKNSVLAE